MLKTDKVALWLITITLIVLIPLPMLGLSLTLGGMALGGEYVRLFSGSAAALAAMGLFVGWLFLRIPRNVEHRVITGGKRKKGRSAGNLFVIWIAFGFVLLAASGITILLVSFAINGSISGTGWLYWLVGVGIAVMMCRAAVRLLREDLRG